MSDLQEEGVPKSGEMINAGLAQRKRVTGHLKWESTTWQWIALVFEDSS